MRTLKNELATYKENLPQLLKQQGKFVLIEGNTIHGVYTSYDDALKIGYDKCGLDKRFLVKEIASLEQVQFISRDLSFA